jgi:hypothetical protein
MKFKPLVVGLAVSGALLASCQPAPSATKKDTAAAQTISADGTVSTPATITAIHDAGYPMFAVTATIAGQTAPLELLLNAEEAELGGQPAESFNGKPVTLGYTSAPEKNLRDVRQGDRSLLGAEAPTLDPAWTFVTGVLSGADDITTSDLPGEIAITDASGAKISFAYFVDPALKAANGKTVTAYYTSDVINRVASIKPAAR